MHKGSTPEALGESNRMLILNYLRKHGSMSRADLCRNLGMSFPAISSNVKSLLNADYIREVGAGDNSIGRKSTLLAFHEERGYIIGMDLGRFWIRATLADLQGNPLASVRRPTDVDHDSQGTIREILELLEQVISDSGRKEDKLLCICIGTPGVVCEDQIKLAPFLPDLSAGEIKQEIHSRFPVEVLIENSINMGAIGEKWKGAGKQYRNFAFINYGVGVGAALVVNGELYKGSHNGAGEIGYMISDPVKLRNRFNEIGVLENTISRDKIQNYISHQNFQQEVNHLIQNYKKEDIYSKVILDEIFLNLGMAFVNLSAFLDLDAIIISGGLGMSLGKLFEEKWEEMLKNHVPFPPQILFSKLDNQEGVLGAISVGIETIHKRPVALLEEN